jgi:phage shock protein PspC (stress-responsive transcriptional regulator)
MNKTISVNISGINFYIEEEAYQKLSSYLNTIKGFFKNSEGGEEIIADIETRISELFQSKIKDAKQVIDQKDVEEIIVIMGEPEQYIDQEDAAKLKEEQAKKQNQQYQQYQQYSGTGSNRRRIFRDPDSDIIGGVCAGISNYFSWDPLILRALFAILFVFFGTGGLIYIILWIILPEAKTPSDKLEMKGEPVNVENIQKEVNETIDKLKNKYNNFSAPNSNKFTNKVSGFFDQLFGLISNALHLFVKVFGKILGVFFIGLGIIFIVIFLSLLFGSTKLIHLGDITNGTVTWTQLSNSFFESGEQSSLFFIGLIIFSIVPIILFIYAGLKLLFNFTTTFKYFGVVLGVTWIIGIILLSVTGIQLASEFNEEVVVEKELTIQQPLGNVMQLELTEDYNKKNWNVKINNGRFISNFDLFSFENDRIKAALTTIDVKESNNATYQLYAEIEAHGSTQKTAMARTERVDFAYSQPNDSTISISPYYSFLSSEKIRGQNVHFVLKVPKGKSVFFNKNTKQALDDVKNVTNTYDGDMVDKQWTVTERGLECIGCILQDNYRRREYSTSSRDETENNEGYY